MGSPPPIVSWPTALRGPGAWALATPIAGLVCMVLPGRARNLALTAVVFFALLVVAAALMKRGRRFPREARGWAWFALSMLLYAAIYGAYLVSMATGAGTFPGPVELLTVPAAVAQVLGLLSFPIVGGRPRERLRTAMDALTFALAMICLQWLGGVAELSSATDLTPFERAYAAAPFVTLTVTMGAIVYLASSKPERYVGVLGLLFMAALFGIINNVSALALALTGSYEFGNPVDLFAALALAFLGAASLWPHPIDHGFPDPRLMRLPAYVPYVPVAAVLALLLERHATDSLGPAAGVLWLVYPLVAVVILRQYLTLEDLSRLSGSLEAEVDKRTRALAAARDELLGARRLEALGRLAGGVAHDFNDLLTDIGGHAHLIARASPPGDPAIGFAVEVQRAVERGAGLTRQILTFARRQPGEPRVFPPAQLVRGLEKLLGRLLDEKAELLVRSDGDPAAAAHVRLDPGQLEQVVVNLVVNARDALPGGAGKIELRVGELEVDAPTAASHDVAPGRFVTIAVADTGEGMTPETRARIFDPFFTTKAPGKGTGLGLATSYGIVRGAGGFFTVASERGKGSTLIVHLPVSDQPPSAQVTSAPVPPTGAGRVLLVDASPLLRATLAEALRASGFEVHEAGGAADAEATLARHGKAVDVVVSDTLLAGERWRTILTSSYHEAPEGELPAHVSLLPKPFLPDDLLRAIAQVTATGTERRA